MCSGRESEETTIATKRRNSYQKYQKRIVVMMHPLVTRFLNLLTFFYEWTSRIVSAVVKMTVQFVVLSWLTVYYFTEAIIWSITPSFLLPKKSIRGKVVLVTGGAGGVGQELVLRLARAKAKVVVWDKNEKALESLKERMKHEGYEITADAVDVSDKEMVYKHAKFLQDDFGALDILINNAGIVCGQTLLEIPDYMIEKTFNVNVLSMYWTIKAFLPDMIKRRSGHIVTVGSLTGMLGTYKCTDYSASKHAVIGFHESLSTELKTHGHHKINMTLICPYFINTNMFDGCKPSTMSMLEPQDVAKRLIQAIKFEEAFVTMPAFSRFALPMKYYIPSKLMWAYLYRVIQHPQAMMTMRSFTPPPTQEIKTIS